MSQPTRDDERPPTEIVGQILADSQSLVAQQCELFALELQKELANRAAGASSFVIGVGLLATSGLLSTLAAVHLIHHRLRIPLWSSYGFVAATAAAVGVHCVRHGQRSGLAEAPKFPETRRAVQENLSWLQDQLLPRSQ